MSVRLAVLGLLTVVALSLSPRPASAQDLAQLYVMSPAPGKSAQFEAAIAAHSEWRRQHDDPWSWVVWEVVNGENVGDFIARSAGHTWADWDAYGGEWASAADAHFNATVGPLLASVSSSITSTDMELSRLPEDLSSINVVSLDAYHLDPAGTQGFTRAFERFHAAATDADLPIHYSLMRLVNGGVGPVMTIGIVCESFACLEGPETSPMELLTDAYGEDEAGELMRSFQGSYHKVESSIVVARWDLSVLPEDGM